MWEKVAKLVQKDYGTYVDWEERFFQCPECGEPIYECDWSDADFADNQICPICEFEDY